jgi:hypothetical protein
MHSLHINRIVLEKRKTKQVMMTKLFSMRKHYSCEAEAVATNAVAPNPSQTADGTRKSR